MLAEPRLKLVVEGVASFFVPAQVVRSNRPGIAQRIVQAKAAIGIDGQSRTVANEIDDGFYPAQVFVERSAADLYLDCVVSKVEVALNLLT